MKIGDKVEIVGTVVDVVYLEADLDNVLIATDSGLELWVRSDAIAAAESAPEIEPEVAPEPEIKQVPKRGKK